MTYCLAWRTETHAFVIADSAITSTRAPQQTHTSFGEAHITGSVQNVEEGALKIIPLGNGAVAFSGPADTGNSFVRVLRSRIDGGQTYEDAFQSAVDSHTPFTQGTSISVLFVYQTDWKPKLRSFNAYNDFKIVEHSVNEAIQIGSIGEGTLTSALSDDFIRCLIDEKSDGVQPSLVCAIALCQLFGIHNNLIQFGVGGTFSGGVVAGDGFHWQQDVAYLLLDPHSTNPQIPERSVLTAVRDDVLLVRSTVAEGSPRAFTTRRLSETSAQTRERMLKANELALEDLNKLQFSYVVLLNTRTSSAVVVSTLRNCMHRELRIDFQGDSNGIGFFRAAISPKLMFALRDMQSFISNATSGAQGSMGILVSYQPYVHPKFDIKHERFEVDFYNVSQGNGALSPEVTAAYQSEQGNKNIFIQNRDGQLFGPGHLVDFWLEKKAKKFEDCIPDTGKRLEGGSTVLPFEINFSPNSFHMTTKEGPADIKRLTLFVRVDWLPETELPFSKPD